MNTYIFLTDEGYTFQPDNDVQPREIENLQVIGFAGGITSDEAYRSLLSENSYLKDTSFEAIFCYRLDQDYEQSRRDYNLKLD